MAVTEPVKVEIVSQRLTWWKILIFVGAVAVFCGPVLWWLFSLPK